MRLLDLPGCGFWQLALGHDPVEFVPLSSWDDWLPVEYKLSSDVRSSLHVQFHMGSESGLLRHLLTHTVHTLPIALLHRVAKDLKALTKPGSLNQVEVVQALMDHDGFRGAAADAMLQRVAELMEARLRRRKKTGEPEGAAEQDADDGGQGAGDLANPRADAILAALAPLELRFADEGDVPAGQALGGEDVEDAPPRG